MTLALRARYQYRFPKLRLKLLLAVALLTSPLWAQGTPALTLDRISTASNGSITFNMNLASPPASIPAGLQWTLSYSPRDVVALNVVAGPALVSAGKTLTCNTTSGSIICLAVGMNANPIADGKVAIVNATIAPGATSPLVPLTLGNVFGVLPEGFADTILPSADVISVAGDSPTIISNLALGKPAAQSSTYPFTTATASLAVDGNSDGNFYDGSVTATNLDPNAWWQVDLGSSANITSVVIWNRTDCCSTQLNDYWVFVSNTPFQDSDTPATLNNRPATWSSHQTSAPSPFVAIAVGAQGRYVRVQLSSSGSLLSLAEVRVMGGSPSATNLAQGKSATQSSTLSGYDTAGPGSAVDGVTNGSFFNGSVTATNLESNPWWQVDLGAPATVRSVTIWNRTDCCALRLNNYWVFVSNTPFSPADTPATLESRAATFSSHQTSAPGPSTTIAIGGAAGFSGRYIRVQLADSGYLSLAEVQVFGEIAANLAQGKTATQSSTLPGFPAVVASAAVDGNPDGNFYHNSVTATNFENNPWWQVDLSTSVAIGSITIWNRTDCCGTRLNDYWIFVSDTPFSATDSPAVLQNRAGTFSSHQTTAPAPSATIPIGAQQGRYVRVQLNGTDYLSLAEVQVFAQ